MNAYVLTYNFIDDILENLNLCTDGYTSTIQDNLPSVVESDIEFDMFSR